MWIAARSAARNEFSHCLKGRRHSSPCQCACPASALASRHIAATHHTLHNEARWHTLALLPSSHTTMLHCKPPVAHRNGPQPTPPSTQGQQQKNTGHIHCYDTHSGKSSRKGRATRTTQQTSRYTSLGILTTRYQIHWAAPTALMPCCNRSRQHSRQPQPIPQ